METPPREIVGHVRVHWYTLPAAPFAKVANGPFKWGLQHRVGLAAPGAGHLCGKQRPGARQPWKAPLDLLGRHVAWRAWRAREIRHNRLRGILVVYTKTTGAVAASEAIPLPRESQPAGREGCAVRTADVHISDPHARTSGAMSELAWPSLSAVCPRNWHAWSRRNAESMGLDRPTQALYLMGLSR